MITREQAIDAAIDDLTSGLRRRLEATEGWPGEAKRCAPGEQLPPSRFRAISADAPDLVEIRASQDEWSVRVPDDEGHVGSSLYVIVDAETGRVFTRMPRGE